MDKDIKTLQKLYHKHFVTITEKEHEWIKCLKERVYNKVKRVVSS